MFVSGHCSEKGRDPPRGLQLILGTKERPHLVDTLVMANLGYWQMKVSPGVWYLQLAPGRSSELYRFKEPGVGNHTYPLSKLVAIDGLRGKLLHIEVEKKRGKEQEDLLNYSDDNQTQEKKVTIFWWNYMSAYLDKHWNNHCNLNPELDNPLPIFKFCQFTSTVSFQMLSNYPYVL